MKAVIMAGGKGTRLAEHLKDKPKPMIDIGGKPLLLHQIDVLSKNGITDITITVGHQKKVIIDYFGDGKPFGVQIDYIEENEPLGTAGALYYLNGKVEDDFILVFGDVLFDIDFNKFLTFHRQKNSLATLFCHPNSHPHDSDLLVMDEDDRLIDFDQKGTVRNYYYHNCVNAGAYIFNKRILDYCQKLQKIDLEKDLLFKLLKIEPIFGYRSPEYIKDVGTGKRLEEVRENYKTGLVKKRSLGQTQKCIFLDRDGTINDHKGLLTSKEQFKLMQGVSDAIKRINASGYLCIVITNQPVIARNLCDFDDLDMIHKKMDTLLGEKGAFVDNLYFCPHHPDSGYLKERKEYKISCECRKPNTGMIMAAQKKYNIKLDASWLIGDTTSDILTAKNAGVKSVLVKTGKAGQDKKYDVKPNFICSTLKSAVELILRENSNGF